VQQLTCSRLRSAAASHGYQATELKGSQHAHCLDHAAAYVPRKGTQERIGHALHEARRHWLTRGASEASDGEGERGAKDPSGASPRHAEVAPAWTPRSTLITLNIAPASEQCVPFRTLWMCSSVSS
jgi:hypothetical protein